MTPEQKICQIGGLQWQDKNYKNFPLALLGKTNNKTLKKFKIPYLGALFAQIQTKMNFSQKLHAKNQKKTIEVILRKTLN